MKQRSLHFLLAGILAIVLISFFSATRERLVPFHSDPDRARWRLTGDEPSYLLTAQAIAAGHGEDVSRVHAAGTYSNFWHKAIIGEKQWRWQHYRKLGCPFLLDRKAAWGKKQVIQRPPLISLFAAPFAYRHNPRWWVLTALEVFASLSAAVLLLLSIRGGAPPFGPWWAVLCFFASPPILFYVCAIFPEALVGCLAGVALLLCRSERPSLRILSYILLLLCLWGTGRVLPAVAAVSVCFAWREWRKRSFYGLATLFAGWTIYFGYNLWLWGYPTPPLQANAGKLSLAAFPKGLLHALMGNDVGLLLLCPVAAAGLVCAVLLVWRHLREPATLPALLFTAASLAVVSSYTDFRAGTCAAGRYQVILAFSMLVLVLLFLAAEPVGSSWRRRVCVYLAILGILSLALGVWLSLHPAWWFERYHPFFKPKPIQHLYAFLPDFNRSWKRPFVGCGVFFAVLFFLPDACRLAVRWLHSRFSGERG